MDEKPRRHWFSFSLRGLLLAVTVVAVFLAVWTRPSISNIDSVKPGMSKEEVLRLVGPPVDVWKGEVEVDRHTYSHENWYWYEHKITVQFDADAGVVRTVFDKGRWRWRE